MSAASNSKAAAKSAMLIGLVMGIVSFKRVSSPCVCRGSRYCEVRRTHFVSDQNAVSQDRRMAMFCPRILRELQ